MKNLYLILVMTLFAASAAYCQHTTTTPQFWISSGIGQVHSEAFNKIGMVGGMGFHVSANHHYFAAQVNQLWELPQEGRVQSEINEMKLQYGWITSIKQQDIYVAAGISSNTYNYFTSTFNIENGTSYDERVVTSNNSLVLETGINWKLTRHIGIGIQALGSFNRTAVTGGYRISALFGLFE